MPLLDLQPPAFHWATGIENTFVPHSRPRLRALDEFELTQHYQLWKQDFDFAAASGARVIRWGMPWYRVQPTPWTWDWAWADAALDYAVNVKGLTVMLDLIHYGTPFWIEKSFVDPVYPRAVGQFAHHVAARYRDLLQVYTPLNEPGITALMCGQRGRWPPHLRGRRGFVQVSVGLARGMIETVHALHAARPDVQTVQVEALWRFQPQVESLRAEVEFRHQLQYLGFDLATGRVDAGHRLHGHLRENGVRESDLAWFRANAVSFDALGVNFYPWSYGIQAARRSGTLYRVPGTTQGRSLAEVLLEAQARYQLPLFITETSARGPRSVRSRWMDETIATVRELRNSGVPLVGYTWFPLLTMIDWRYRTGTRPVSDYLLHLGLVESRLDEANVLQRQPTELLEKYRAYTLQPMPWNPPTLPSPAGRGALDESQPND